MAIQTPNGPKANKGEVKQILNLLKDYVTTATLADIALLLNPCCAASITFDTFSCDTTDGVFGVVLENVTITAPISLANKFVSLVLQAQEQAGGAVMVIELDSNAQWNGDIQTSWGASLSTITVDGGIVYNRVTLNFPPTVLTGLPNCD